MGPWRTTAQGFYTAFAVPPVVSALTLAVYFGSNAVMPVVLLYWVAVLAILGSLFFARRLPMWWAISVAATVALRAPRGKTGTLVFIASTTEVICRD